MKCVAPPLHKKLVLPLCFHDMSLLDQETWHVNLCLYKWTCVYFQERKVWLYLLNFVV
jgi:hypothetical protein